MTTDALNMAHAPIPPIHIGATVPESFTVLQHRIIAAEEQTDAIIQELESLGFGVEASGVPKINDYNSHRPVSPLHARKAFGVESEVLWKNYEFLVSRVCRLESVIQTMKLNLFRIQTAKELNPEYSVDQLAAMQEEHVQEVKKIQRDIMRFRQQLNEVSEEKEAAQDEIERLSAALEITTTTKTNMAMAAEERKATNTRMSHKMQEVTQELAQEVNLRKALEESHIHLLQRVQELDKVVEIERKQVKVLQQDSLALRKNEQMTQERLQQELQKASDFEKIQKQLKIESEAKKSIISLLADEGKKTQLMLKSQQEENANLQNEIASLRNLVEKLQALNDQLDAQCTEMSDTLRSLSVENANIIIEHETSLKGEQEKMKEKLHEQELLLDAARASISADLQCAVNEKHQLKTKLEALRLKYMEMQQKCETMQKRAITQQMLLESEITHLKENLKTSVNECEHIKKEKETQMDQAKNTIDNITKEKNILEKQVTENQSRVQKLQEELQCRFDAGFENDQLRKVNALLETKYSQIQLILEQKVKDLALTVISHDQALSETQKLKDHIEMMEDKERQKITNLQRHLTDSKQDNSQMAATVENVLSSHRQLQQTMDKLQMELGQRIMEIHSLQKDKSHAQIILQRLQAELEDLQGKLANMEAQHNVCSRKCSPTPGSLKGMPFHKGLDVARQDNKKLANSLEQTLHASNNLQIKLNRLQDELDNKENQQQQLLHNREQETENAKMESKIFNEQIETLKKQFQNEREIVRKASQKEIIELRKALDETTSRSADLSRANRELRLKVTEFEKSIMCLKAKIKDQKTQLKHYLESKKTAAQNTERIKEFEADLKQMEIIKDQYQKKNNEQSQMILTFRKEMQMLQEELQNVAKSQNEASSLYRQQEIQLKKERKLSLELRNKCQGLEEKVKHLQNCTEETEHKLKEASLESQQISANLEEAHKWFKSKFDRHQTELIKTRGIDTSKEQLCNCENFKKTSREICLSSRQKSKAIACPADARQVMRHRKSSTSPERDDLT
ncbi:coiled-coil domain-containing protein 150 isoform X1 [Amblyraja radiata]|uniref:coiled-coil domain-containing protein 150 isoform X1 n=1 Tax=Amblyraja radiata TaxID=386614 RepID=UPI001401EFC3|nr:coiled-coil domain-containing protein 150 isoform X1 [Amblyraja radiata]